MLTFGSPFDFKSYNRAMKMLSVILFLIGLLPALFLWFVFVAGDEATRIYSIGVFGPLALLTLLSILLFIVSHFRKRILN